MKQAEHEKAMAEAIERAKKEAEIRVANEMAEAVRKVEEAAAESVARNREKQARDMLRPDFESKGLDDNFHEHKLRVSLAQNGRAPSRRLSVMKDRASMHSQTNVHEDEEVVPGADIEEVPPSVPLDDTDAPSLLNAKSKIVVNEEFFDVVIDRDQPGGTLGIAVDLWDGEVRNLCVLCFTALLQKG